MTGILQVILFLIVLTIFHEIGHLISAKILKLPINKIGFQLEPYPSVFVSVDWPNIKIKKDIYLYSGTFITLCLFITSWVFNFFDNKFLYIAFSLKLITESNPFYSDFTISIVTNLYSEKFTKLQINLYKKMFSKYQFSFIWYLHFVLWFFIIFILLIIYKNIAL